jgi:hypothetical protein
LNIRFEVSLAIVACLVAAALVAQITYLLLRENPRQARSVRLWIFVVIGLGLILVYLSPWGP